MYEALEARLAVIEAVLLRLEAQLLGNGQPGEIEIIKRRVTRLEAWFWRATGAVALLLALAGLLERGFARLVGH